MTIFLGHPIICFWYHFTQNRKAAWFSYATAYLFFGMSPWFIVAYSDATGIIFPILVIRMYQLSRKPSSPSVKALWWFLIGGVSMFAYWIKPHLMIALIAIIIVEISCFKKQISKREIGIIIKRIAATIAGVAVSACIYNFAIVPSLHLQLNPEKTLGFQHYLMMGLNESSDGVYWEDDVSFTKSFATNAERNQADMEKAKERIKKFGIQGLIHHLSRKQLVNYGDGTFAWAVEGHSFNGDPDWAKNKLSAEIDSYIRPEGSHYNFQS